MDLVKALTQDESEWLECCGVFNKAFIEIWLKTQFLFYLLILTVFLYTCFMNKAEPVPEYTYQTLLLAKYCVIN